MTSEMTSEMEAEKTPLLTEEPTGLTRVQSGETYLGPHVCIDENGKVIFIERTNQNVVDKFIAHRTNPVGKPNKVPHTDWITKILSRPA